MSKSRIGTAVLELATESGAFFKDLDQVEKRFTGLDRSAADLGKSLQSFGRDTSAIGRSLSLGLTAPILGVGAAAIKLGTDFNASMANVATLIPNSSARIDDLKRSVQDLAVATGKGTADLSDGLYQVISAFGDGADTVKILETNAKAAAAGLATTNDSINLTSAITKAYGDTSAAAVGKVSDLALMTVRLGQTTFPELAAAMGKVTPIAQAMGVSQEELFNVFATATGVTGTAAEVTTQYRGVLAGLLNPTEALNELITAQGFASGKAMLQQEGLIGTLRAIVAASEASGTPITKYISSIEAVPLALALAGAQGDVFTTKLGEMSKAAGTTDVAFAEQTQGVNKAGFAWAQFQQSMAVVAQRLGDTLIPVLTRAWQSLKPLVDWAVGAFAAFQKLPQPIQTAAVVLAGIAAAVGPVLMVVGALIGAVGSLLAAFGSTVTVGALITGAFGLLLSPIALVGAAIAGLALAWWKWGDDVTRVVSETWASIKAWLWDKLGPVLTPIGGLLDAIGEMFTAFGRLVGAVAGLALDHVITFVRGVVSWIGEKLKPVIDPALALFRLIATVVGEVATKAVGFAQQLYDGVKGWLLDKFTAVVNSIKEKVNAVTEAFRVMYDKVVGHSYVPDMVNGVAAEFERLKTIMVGATTTATAAVSEKFEALAAEVPLALQGLSDTIGRVFNEDIKGTFDRFASGPLGELFTKIDENFNGRLSAAVTKGVDVFQNGLRSFQGFARVFAGDLSGIGDAVMGAWNVVAQIGPQIAGVFRSLFGGPSAAELAGREIVSNFEANVQSMLSDTQRLEAGNESWRRTVVVVRDAYMAMGRTEAEALAAVDALWRSSKGGADAVTAAMIPIQEALDFVARESERTGLSFEELRALGVAGAQDIEAGLTAVGDEAAAVTLEELEALAERLKFADSPTAIGAVTQALDAQRGAVAQLVGSIPSQVVVPVSFHINQPDFSQWPDFDARGIPVLPMAEGGMGHITKPTLFLGGEEPGGEDFAFSGTGRTFGEGGGLGDVQGVRSDLRALRSAIDRQSDLLISGFRDAVVQLGS